MSLAVRNSKELLDPKNLKLKVLVHGIAGSGKTSWLGTVPDIGVAVCETGLGKGMATIAERNVDFVEPTTLDEFDQFCSGVGPATFKTKSALGVDSLSEMVRTFIKDHALSIPNSRGDTQTRRLGVPELRDYGVMGELTRRLVRRLLDQDKHIVVTATLRFDKPDPETGQGELLIGPDLPGAMFLAAPAMFDVVMCMRTRSVLRDPKDPKSKYTQRYLVTEAQGGMIVKNRHTVNGKSLLAPEEIFDLETGQGTFPYLLDKITKGYAAAAVAKAA